MRMQASTQFTGLAALRPVTHLRVRCWLPQPQVAAAQRLL